MKKYLGPIIFCCAVVSVILIGIIYSAVESANDYVRITDLDYTAVVVDEKQGDNGKVVITERLTFDIHAASKNNTFWELWRDLPEEYVDGAKVSYNVLSVKRLSTNGEPDYLEFEPARKLYWYDNDYISKADGLGPNRWFHSKGPYDGTYNFECVLFYVDGLYRQTVEFEIEYEMFNASLRYGDSSELYLSLYSGKDVKHLNSVKGQILFPDHKMPSKYNAYTYGTNAHEFDFVGSDSLNPGYYTFAFELDKSQLKFKNYNQYIEFALVSFGEDKHKFTEFASNNIYSTANVHSDILKAQADYEALPAKAKANKITVLCVFSALIILIIYIVFLFDKRRRNKCKLLTATQKFDFYKEIPSELDAVFAGSLCFCKHKRSYIPPGGYAAAMLGLVQKGYIDLTQNKSSSSWTQTNTYINITKNKFNTETGKSILPPLTKTEELYYSLIRRHAEKRSSPITIADFQEKMALDYEYTHSFDKNMKNAVKTVGVSEGYLRAMDYKDLKNSFLSKIIFFIVLGSLSLIANLISVRTRLDLAFGAFFVLGIGFYGVALLIKLQSRKCVLLTQKGEDEYSKWRGLYKYLNSETLINEREVPDIAIWEEYLLYATAFGIPEKVIKALKVKMPDYNLANSRSIGHPYFRTRAFTRMHIRSSRSSVRRASFSSRVGSHGGGFGGGGGYGGGGRGGGGGGGGH